MARLTVAAVTLVAFVAVWGLPNVAGSRFVAVRVAAVAIGSGQGEAARKLVLGNGPSTSAGALRVVIGVDGRYPTPVVVAWTNPPLRLEIVAVQADGTTRTVATFTASSPMFETGADSPTETVDDAVVVIRPGLVELPIGPPSGTPLTDSSGEPLPAGAYLLQGWALGIKSQPLPLTVLE